MVIQILYPIFRSRMNIAATYQKLCLKPFKQYSRPSQTCRRLDKVTRSKQLTKSTIRVWAQQQSSDFSEKPDYVSPEQVKISEKLMQDMQQKIGQALESDQVKVVDAYGDSQHVSINVISTLFEGKSAVQRQRMVYKAIWWELQNVVHAVDSMKTLTPEEAAQQQ
eukprot:TRINITY_DN12168_c0_g2_i12.p1 TRINITY_DN12168_c0_g2~~TRINITY_DN12168_c0_g2_i12.p1  ORF type:complete len:190 (-),score=8.86 TRINITY_DN12168_c0_g2_i12:166-660(-)